MPGVSVLDGIGWMDGLQVLRKFIFLEIRIMQISVRFSFSYSLGIFRFFFLRFDYAAFIRWHAWTMCRGIP